MKIFTTKSSSRRQSWTNLHDETIKESFALSNATALHWRLSALQELHRTLTLSLSLLCHINESSSKGNDIAVIACMQIVGSRWVGWAAMLMCLCSLVFWVWCAFDYLVQFNRVDYMQKAVLNKHSKNRKGCGTFLLFGRLALDLLLCVAHRLSDYG